MADPDKLSSPSSAEPADRPAPVPAPLPAQGVDTVAALVAAREARGLTPADVVAALKLSPRQVAALESGDWSALPGLAFCRAALRSYGRLLGVSVEPLVASLLQGIAAPELREAASLRAPLPRTGLLGFGAGGSGSRLAWLVLAAALLIVIGLFFGRPAALPGLVGAGGSTPAPRAAPVSPPVVEPPAAAAPVAASPVPSATPAPAPSSSPASSPAPASTPPAPASTPPAPSSTPPAPSSTPPAAAAPAPVPSSSPVAGAAFPMLVPARAELVLRFERESWVEIRRADGQVVLEGLQRAGSEARVPLVAELALVVGNADFVRIERGGVPVDLKPLIRQGVARLKLAP